MADERDRDDLERDSPVTDENTRALDEDELEDAEADEEDEVEEDEPE